MFRLFLFYFIIGNCVLANDIIPSQFQNLQWEVVTEKNNVKVYSPIKFKHASGIVPVKFEGIVKHHISKVLSVMADDSRKYEWVPRAKQIIKLEEINSADFTSYYRYDSPWPFSDRDFIIKNEGYFDESSLTVSVKLYSVDHPKDPARNHNETVRGTSYGGYVIISPLSYESTKIEMTLMNDFGGNIPTWIINIVQKKWPYSFIRNLRKQLSKKDIVINPAYIRKEK